MVYEAFVSWLDPILLPLVGISPFLAVLVVAFIVALFIKFIYLKTTDQVVMKALREDLKKMQGDMKKYKDNMKKLQEINMKAMEKNMEYMKQSFKPLIWTTIPVLIFFGWLSLNVSYLPFTSNQDIVATVHLDELSSGTLSLQVLREQTKDRAVEVTVARSTQIIDAANASASFNIRGPAGKYQLLYTFTNGSTDQPAATAKHNLIIGEGQKYANPKVIISDKTQFRELTLSNQPRTIFTLFGWDVNWFWAYFIFSTIFAIALQKIMGLH